MEWSEFVEAATTTSWFTYLGTADAAGHPHVSMVAPGFTEATIWVATRPSSKKYRNLAENPAVAFHWPAQPGGPGELFASGGATLRASAADRHELWVSGVMPYDLHQFWSGPDDQDLAIVEVRIARAGLTGPDLVTRRWHPTSSP
jgi:general stress protein 26